MKVKKIIIAFLFLLFTASILLMLDLGNRKSVSKQKLPKLAVFKMASLAVLDDAESGIIEGLKQQGFVHGKSCTIQHFTAEGDMPTANTIAQNIVSSRFDMVITISTPSLQVMANANKEGAVTHVFCAVTDPYVAGVGITGPNPDQHPAHLVGIGTFQPVEAAFDIAKQMYPDLKKVGTVWCPSEVCSEACLRLARTKCKDLGIELVEMSVENTTQIYESALSVTARGVDALWLGGDNVIERGIDQLINAATKAEIPLFTNNPYNVRGNVLFGVGASYFEVGRIAGNMASEILNGKPTSEIRVDNAMPQQLNVNAKALDNMSEQWDISKFEQ
ncbi:MAG TPA: ABC transporter substrate-binding protein [Prolixibacteraceae bacterium]|nr:ABC transporter substrate-binding protein [Prolixibacteraceae bacterium]